MVPYTPGVQEHASPQIPASALIATFGIDITFPGSWAITKADIKYKNVISH